MRDSSPLPPPKLPRQRDPLHSKGTDVFLFGVIVCLKETEKLYGGIEIQFSKCLVWNNLNLAI